MIELSDDEELVPIGPSVGDVYQELRKKHWRPIRRFLLERGVDATTYIHYRDRLSSQVIRYVEMFCVTSFAIRKKAK